MPVKLLLDESEEQGARIEIIPLIDIMFFLLAAFMLVSLSMSHFKGLKVDLPVAVTADSAAATLGQVNLSVDKAGVIYWEKEVLTSSGLVERLVSMKAANPDLKVYIRGDYRATHGAIVHVLDKVRSAGIQQVAFEIKKSARGQ